MLHVSLHVFRNILAANCRIRFQDDSETIDAMRINLDSTYLHVSLLCNGNLQNTLGFFSPKDFFIPISVSGVSAGTSFKISETSDAQFLTNESSVTAQGKRVFESSFRFQIPNNDVLQLIESKLNEDINFFNTTFMMDDISQRSQAHIPIDLKEIIRLLIKPETLYRMQCTACNVPLGEAIFNDIKDHCDESFAEGWFCHQSDDLRINDSLSSECLYIDETSFLIPGSILNQKSCSCGSLLCTEGPDPKGFVRVYFDKIYFRNTLWRFALSLSACGKDYRKWMCVRTLWSLMEKSRTPSLFTKMLLQSKQNKRPTEDSQTEDTCLLLMIPKEKVSHCHIRSPIISCTSSIRTEPAYHVLYQVGTHASKDVKTWRHAFDVDFYRVSDVMMHILIEFLKDSLFEDEPVESGFTYGYLPAC